MCFASRNLYFTVADTFKDTKKQQSILNSNIKHGQTFIMSFSERPWTFLLAQVWFSAVISATYTLKWQNKELQISGERKESDFMRTTPHLKPFGFSGAPELFEMFNSVIDRV